MFRFFVPLLLILTVSHSFAFEQKEIFIGYQTKKFPTAACGQDRVDAKKQLAKIVLEQTGKEVYPLTSCTKYSIDPSRYLFAIHLVFNGNTEEIMKLKQAFKNFTFKGRNISFTYLWSEQLQWQSKYKAIAADLKKGRDFATPILFEKTFPSRNAERNWFKQFYGNDHKLSLSEAIDFFETQTPNSKDIVRKFYESHKGLFLGINSLEYVHLLDQDTIFQVGWPTRRID